MRRFLSLILLFLPFNLFSQSWEVGAFAGGSGYNGDFLDTRPYTNTDISYGLQFKKNFNGYWSAKLNLMRGKIRADDAESPNAWQQERNLRFFTPITETTAQVELNMFNFLPGMDRGKRWSPYLFTGVGTVFFNPQTDYNGSVVELQPLQTENTEYKKWAVTVPYGAGLKYNIGSFWNIIGEVGYRTVYSDYLDDLSGRYPNPAELQSNLARALSDRSAERGGAALAVPGLQRGDLRKRDGYVFVGLSLSYTFVSSKCYAF